MKYNYNSELECFIREDGLGKKIWINSTEAHRIMTMYDLGNSIGEIRNKIKFTYPRKVTESTITNFIRNVREGNIILDDNLPAPSDLVVDLTLDERVRRVEDRLDILEELLGSHNNDETLSEKVKSWIRL